MVVEEINQFLTIFEKLCIRNFQIFIPKNVLWVMTVDMKELLECLSDRSARIGISISPVLLLILASSYIF